jgi:O-6-methylguanine DNA methyltransferase
VNTFQFPVSFGTIVVSWDVPGQLKKIQWAEDPRGFLQRVQIPSEFLDLVSQMRRYFFRGEPLGSIPWERMDQSEWSIFQTKVYQVTSTIPHGETRTYGWVARQLGQASASRAVGQALRNNPFPILIPCHRVFAARSMGGFMGAVDPNQPELQLKKKLNLMEEEFCSPIFSFLASSRVELTG